jgi:hypothetical protein
MIGEYGGISGKGLLKKAKVVGRVIRRCSPTTIPRSVRSQPGGKGTSPLPTGGPLR